MNTRMRTTMKLATVVALVAVLAVPAQGAQGGGAGKVKKANRCGGKWVSGATCNFKYAGGAINIGGSYQAETLGFISVTVEAENAEGVRVPVVSCGTTAGQFGGCATSTSDGGMLPAPELEKGQRLFCTVTGADEGKYSCKSLAG